MSCFNSNSRAVVLFVLLMGLAGLSGCTDIEASTLDVAAADVQVAANALESRPSPTYYRDDPAVIHSDVPLSDCPGPAEGFWRKRALPATMKLSCAHEPSATSKESNNP